MRNAKQQTRPSSLSCGGNAWQPERHGSDGGGLFRHATSYVLAHVIMTRFALNLSKRRLA